MSSKQSEAPAVPAKGPLALTFPLQVLAISTWFIIPTTISLLRNFQFAPFFSLSLFKDHWFARFWHYFGPRSREVAAPVVTTLLRNNAHGVCLDIGPGSGEWLYLFAQADNPSITKIYGVEPNLALHKALRANAVKAGLGDVYEIIGCGAQDLSTKGGIDNESIDTIITVQCLCSIPTPQLIIRNLYPLLKPGGSWLVFEHIKTKYEGHFVAYYQRFLNIFWPHFINGCELTRPTDEWLLQAGEWDQVDLRGVADEGAYSAVPHAKGHLVKKKSALRQ